MVNTKQCSRKKRSEEGCPARIIQEEKKRLTRDSKVTQSQTPQQRRAIQHHKRKETTPKTRRILQQKKEICTLKRKIAKLDYKNTYKETGGGHRKRPRLRKRIVTEKKVTEYYYSASGSDIEASDEEG